MSSSARRRYEVDFARSFGEQNMPSEQRTKLLGLLAKYAYDYKPGGFALASGQVSDEYLDCKMALSHPEAMPLLGAIFLAELHRDAVAVGGLTMGADPVAMATAYASAGGRAVRWFTVRKQPKEHGRRKLIEGDVPDASQVVIVDDVVTTGGSTVEAIEKVRAAKLHVAQVLVLVDREQDNGMSRIRTTAGPDVEVKAIFTKSEVRAAWESQRQTLRATA